MCFTKHLTTHVRLNLSHNIDKDGNKEIKDSEKAIIVLVIIIIILIIAKKQL